MKTKPENVQFNIELPRELRKRLNMIAASRDVSQGELVAGVLTEFVRKQQKPLLQEIERSPFDWPMTPFISNAILTR